MRTKLTLNLEDLSVESFGTTVTHQEKGTVFGEQECTCGATCTCPGCPSCDPTCEETCVETCGYADTCYGSCRPSKCESCWITCTEPNTLDYC
jgi:hypothetical protein